MDFTRKGSVNYDLFNKQVVLFNNALLFYNELIHKKADFIAWIYLSGCYLLILLILIFHLLAQGHDGMHK